MFLHVYSEFDTLVNRANDNLIHQKQTNSLEAAITLNNKKIIHS